MTVLFSYQELKTRLSESTIIPPHGSILRLEGEEIMVMARAYCLDAVTFARDSDPVNELAACWYALAWLDCGECQGVVRTGSHGREWPPGSPDIGPEAGEKLKEKTFRYQRMLTGACNGVERSGEEDTIPGDAANRILAVGRLFLAWGGEFIRTGRMDSALACFSYGHGWLDCGVRTGLFRITGARDLFTV